MFFKLKRKKILVVCSDGSCVVQKSSALINCPKIQFKEIDILNSESYKKPDKDFKNLSIQNFDLKYLKV